MNPVPVNRNRNSGSVPVSGRIIWSFSRYYSDARGQGATRIDRQYHFGNIQIKEAKYLPLAFSDHHGHVVTISIPEQLSTIICPKGRQSFRLQDEVILDQEFQQNLRESMSNWQNVRNFGMDTLVWWELVVKPGVKQLGMVRGKQIKKDRHSALNLLLVRQAYVNKKIKLGNQEWLGELKTIHRLIQNWYETECSKIKDQSRANHYPHHKEHL